MDAIFEALASLPRRKILAFLSATDLTAGEIASRFAMSKPAISKHLQILENAGLVTATREGQFIRYALVRESLVNTLNSYVQEVCPVSRPLKRESRKLSRGAGREPKAGKAKA
ncbi:MAG TPA: metalloregulator ArsR/SmtB family transcription factor [Hyphomonadaceae bacterium]|nr:metalloregulator ArsR/SmtB family transcription factor [Hyphomonadaceae bacterium]HPI49226.1 metalloregulator ArsR/SmtB family transcription factor [Hyphomonadaceae bacterium]